MDTRCTFHEKYNNKPENKLSRFITAQNQIGYGGKTVYENAKDELRNGRKPISKLRFPSLAV